MPKKPSAGDLYWRVALYERGEENPDSPEDYGNTQTGWIKQFESRADILYAGGGETVMAARLEGRGVYKVRLRSSTNTRSIKQDWQMRDARLGTEYAIKQADTITDRSWVYLVVEQGVAA